MKNIFNIILKMYKKNCILFLLMIWLAQNTKILNIIKIMLFFINFNKKYNLLEELIENKSKTLIVNQIDIFKRIYNNIIKI